MTRGRKPTPAGIKALRGNSGKRPDRQAGPPAAWPRFTCPRSLGKRGSRHFHTLLRELTRCGVAPSASPDLIILYATVKLRWDQAEQKIAKYGSLVPVVKATKAGPVKVIEVNPYLAIADEAHRQMLKILIECGLTPTARSRITTSIEPPQDELEEFMKNDKKASG